jgi:hypothetical protein
MPGHGSTAVQVMLTARTGEEGARRTRATRRTDLGGWDGRKLTGVGCPRRRAGDRSAQRWQTEGEVAGAGGDVGEQQDADGVLEEVAAGWFGAGGGPSVASCPAVEDVEGGWRPRAVFGPALRAEHKDGTVGDAPRRMRATTRVA